MPTCVCACMYVCVCVCVCTLLNLALNEHKTQLSIMEDTDDMEKSFGDENILDKLKSSIATVDPSSSPSSSETGVKVWVKEEGQSYSTACKGSQEEEEEEEEEEENKFVSKESRVPDGGWGWMVAVGSCIVSCLIHSLPFCFGIMFSGFLLDNGASSSSVAWIYNLYLVLWNVALVFTNPLCQQFGQRAVGGVSVLMACISLVVSGFAPSVTFLFFSFSILGGVPAGLSIGIAFTVLAPYFDKRKGEANILMVIGAPMTQVVLSPLIRYLLEEYSFKGTALIHSAIVLNALVAVSFFHPVKWHLKHSSGEKTQPQQDTLQALVPGKDTSRTVRTKTPGAAVPPQHSAARPREECVQVVPRLFSGSVSSLVSVRSDVDIGLVFLSQQTLESPAAGITKPRGAQTLWRNLLGVVETTKSDVRLLRQLRCVILAVTTLLIQTSFLNFLMMLPFVVLAAHQTLQDAAQCISLMGVSNLVIRIVVSPLSDCRWFSIRACIMAGFCLRAASIITVSLSSEVWQFLASGIVYGAGMGMSKSLHVLFIGMVMGVENVRPTMGVIGLVTAMGMLILGPLIGLIRDVADSYAISLCVLAGLDLISVGLWCLMPAAQARDARTKGQGQHSKPRPPAHP